MPTYVPIELGVKFRSDVAGAITGIGFFKAPGDNSEHTGSLWTSGGVLLATGAFTDETASGWQQLTFSTPVPINANTTYIASYHTSGFGIDAGYFRTRGFDNGPLHALQSGVDGANGVYLYGPGGQFPSGPSESNNYWVDVTFTTHPAAPQPGAPPPGSSIWPDSATPSIPFYADSPVELGVKFRSDVAGTITGIRFYKGAGNNGTHTGSLWSSSGALLATGTFTNETATGWQVLTFATPVPISANTTYIASYHTNTGLSVDIGYFQNHGAGNAPLHALQSGVDGANGVYIYGPGGMFPSQGSSGNKYWVDVFFNPSTASLPPPSSTSSIWPGFASPAAFIPTFIPIELGVKFRSDVAGMITGIRFYKVAGDAGPHTGSLWSSNGSLLATGTFTNETPSGWQQLTFSTPVAISANTTYIASYHTTAFGIDAGYFQMHGFDNGPLHALQSGVDGANGVYLYGPGGQFPSSPSDSNNYWVDIVFVH
jgi:hypothetical protein